MNHDRDYRHILLWSSDDIGYETFCSDQVMIEVRQMLYIDQVIIEVTEIVGFYLMMI